ncbi:ABC transporter substrate-binding protein [Duganella rhizosphaerae]|uniref:substrate-binding periplasmic protein n=1 Tax=Duganella rhizosphaerae TaxID=2885763 RepID=UPI0030EA11D8
MRAKLATALLCALALLARAESPEPLRLVAADLPPYAVAAGGDSPGSLVEIVQELARRVGTPATVEFYPWQRALALTGVLPHTAVLPLTRTPEREPQYRWLVRLRQQNFVFVARHGSIDPRELRDPAGLARRRPIAVLRGSPHKQVLQSLNFSAVAECASVRECMRMVTKGVADATYGGEDIHRHAANLDGHREADFDFSPVFRSGDIWLGGSLDFSEDEARKWRAAYEAMRADGSLARIQRKYGLAGN